MPKKIYHKKSPIHGNGIFALKDIKEGEIVCIIKGPNMFKINHNLKDVFSNPDWVGYKVHNWVDPIPPYKYLNHSCSPNTAIKGHKTIVSTRYIHKGEEITVDYSIIEADSRWHMKCSCGAKNCRGTIGPIQKLPPKMYNKYLPHISKEFQKIHNEYIEETK